MVLRWITFIRPVITWALWRAAGWTAGSQHRQVSDNENVHYRQTYGGTPVSHPTFLERNSISATECKIYDKLIHHFCDKICRINLFCNQMRFLRRNAISPSEQISSTECHLSDRMQAERHFCAQARFLRDGNEISATAPAISATEYDFCNE